MQKVGGRGFTVPTRTTALAWEARIMEMPD